MRGFLSLQVIAVIATSATGSPLTIRNLSDPNYGPVPGESSYYSDYTGRAPPFPANVTAPILPSAKGQPGPDDRLFQNLLAAEWAIFSFYQQGVEVFNASSFTALGFPNTTYSRLLEIRDTEAGHMRIFQDSISPTSIKPGSCAYDFGFQYSDDASVATFLALQTLIEVSSMVFAAGLVRQAITDETKSALVGIGETETRHGIWALIDIWHVDPFAGPIDTVYPYANQILDSTNRFIVPGSCPSINPVYPSPRQNLPQLSSNSTVGVGTPGNMIVFEFVDPENVPVFKRGCDYYAVFFHGLETISVPLDISKLSSVIPGELEEKGIILVVLSDKKDAPTQDSVLAGPLFLLQQPSALQTQFPK
ncbi:hypothetical protein OIDMADRAFT_45313 [Oidiodendron maius Zn]|uniref:Uncharacterized protein n=1 Tax=Oidiodendron maius (strain Zn) TaxID=913774 RepID=A0A0C3GU44_OIDMZ|nr:hypothetical protein OIDMADRAFT_45313 [Oidiodendron maius Zn]